MNAFRLDRPISTWILVALTCLIAISCSDSDKETLLTPSGEVGGSGTIQGVLSFDGEIGASVATVYALRNYDESCVSAFRTIHVTGTMNDWDTGIWTSSPGMRYLGGCYWADRVELTAGSMAWKFVTNQGWGNDYATTGADAALVGETVLADGAGNDLEAIVIEAGIYNFILYEDPIPAQYAVVTDAGAAPLTTSELLTGEFAIDDLPAGTYELVIISDSAEFLDFHVSGVVLEADGFVDLETVEISSSSGAITGRVLFAGDPDPLPKALVDAVPLGGGAGARDSTDANGNFRLTGLQSGTYDIEISADGYLSATVDEVEFVNGVDTNVPDVTLTAGCESQWTTIQVLGEFNSWDESMPSMTQVSSCVWRDTVTVVVASEEGTRFFMKFRTNENWSSPAYGTCGAETDTLGLAGDLCSAIDGPALPILFPVTGEYEFELDESTETYKITSLSEIETGSLSGRVTYSDSPTDPPRTTIVVSSEGSEVATGETQPGGVFRISTLVAGSYDVAVSAPGYSTSSLTDVEVVGNADTDLGTIALEATTKCTPVADFVQVVGDFNDWDTSAASMTPIETCVWLDTVTVVIPAGREALFMKFRTGNAWGSPPDYGTCLAETDTLGLKGEVCADNDGPALPIRFPFTGDYEFRLDERTQTFTITALTEVELGAIAGTIGFSDNPSSLPTATIRVFPDGEGQAVATVQSDENGNFLAADLTGGTFDLSVEAAGYQTTRLEDVEVQLGQTTAVGTISIERKGSLSGTVSYSDSPDPLPTTTVVVSRTDTGQQVASTTATSGAWSAIGLDAGTYDVTVSAPGYEPASVESLDVVLGADTAAGNVELVPISSCEPSSVVRVSGLNNLFPGPDMTLLEACSWVDTLSVDISADPDSTLLFAFQTNGNWGEEWGRCGADGNVGFEDGVSVGEVCRGVSNWFNMKFPASGEYRFEIDEQGQTFRVTLLE